MEKAAQRGRFALPHGDPKDLSLAEGSVHVWRAELGNATPEVLSSDERERAAKFHFEKDRNRYTAARAILRQLIGRYEKMPAEALKFAYNTFGKPALDGSSLRFNMSHSGGLALFAFTRNRNIGVDLERIRPDFTSREIAGQFFSPDEIAALRGLPVESQTAAFFACWTRKEAFIKAHGSGLSLPLHKFVVSLNMPARLVRTDFDPDAVGQWTLHELEAGEGFAAALAVEGMPKGIECWEWK
jgi:4'-phosphopantetheinyl transferase